MQACARQSPNNNCDAEVDVQRLLNLVADFTTKPGTLATYFEFAKDV